MSEGVLWDLCRGATATRVLGIAAELGVADALAAGPRPVAEIAAEVGADPRTLDRYLRALASDGVFAEEAPGVYRNTEASELLRRGTPWNAFAQLYGGVWHRAAGALDAAGAKAFEGEFWDWLADHPRERALFDLAMEDGTEQRVDRIAGLVLARRRDGRRRRRRERLAAARALRTPAGHARSGPRPAGDRS